MSARTLVERPLVWCRACNTERELGEFELFGEEPLRYYDFCVTCAHLSGYQALYEKYKTGVSPEVAYFVLNAPEDSRPASHALVRAPSATERELARREYCRRRLLYYVTQFSDSYKAGWVHQDITRRLEQFMRDVEAGRGPRLMLFMPPRHGKSRLASAETPSWVLGHHPEWEIIIASYAQGLPVKFSRDIRDRLKDSRYRAIFPECALRSDSQGVEEWRTTKGGGVLAAGVGVGISGRGAHMLIVDDPIADYEQAQSQTVRETAGNWYTSTARPRLAPGGGVLFIQTRWHDDDLSGRQISAMKAAEEAGLAPDEYDRWEIVSYPAIAEADEYLMPDGSIEADPPTVGAGARRLRAKGEALHPARYPIKELMRLKNTMPPVQWNALYQQNPVPESGAFFVADHFRFTPVLPGTPEEYTFFTAWDLAIGQKATNDWTVGAVGALNSANTLYVVDMIRARMITPEIVKAAIEMGVKWPLLQLFGMEQGQIYKTLEPELMAAMQANKVRFSLYDRLVPVTDKLLRARPLQSRMQMGQLYFLNEPWAYKAQQELLRFPTGTFDDMVDALAWLARMALVVTPPVLGRRAKARKSWKDDVRIARSAATSYMTA